LLFIEREVGAGLTSPPISSLLGRGYRVGGAWVTYIGVIECKVCYNSHIAFYFGYYTLKLYTY